MFRFPIPGSTPPARLLMRIHPLIAVPPAACRRASTETLAVSVVIPVRNHAEMLRHCLESVKRHGRQEFELIVVDDDSTDSSADVARSFGCRVIQVGARGGPGAARNLGAQAARGEVLVFLDADVCVHADTFDRLLEPLAAESVSAVFGSYDARPGAPQFVSQFKNLLHHYVHQTAQCEASTFWAGCGAIRKSVFMEQNGFGSSFVHPSVEDIELGLRLRKAGHRVRISKEAQVTHLKRWTLGRMCATDIWRRGVPWSCLILREKKIPNDLNVRYSQRASVLFLLLLVVAFCAVAWTQPWVLFLPLVALLGLQMVDACGGRHRWLPGAAVSTGVGAAGVFAASHVPVALAVGGTAMVGIGWANARFYRFLWRSRGRTFVLAAFPVHLLYFLSCAVAAAIAVVRHLGSGMFACLSARVEEPDGRGAWSDRQKGLRRFPQRRSLVAILKPWALIAAVCMAVVAYQYGTSAYRVDIYGDDAPAHFVTGVMIADYVRSALGANPVAFAEDYYLRAPKVAFGHWPPVFHFVQASWYLVWGASKTSAALLMGAITAAALVCLFLRVSRIYGPYFAALGTLVFASFPAVRWNTRVLMSDMLTLLLCMLAAFALADFVTSRRSRDLLQVFGWSLLGVLTKENALHLLLLVPFALVAAGGWSILRDRRLYGGGLVILAVGGGLFALKVFSGSAIHGYHDLGHLVRQVLVIDDSPAILVAFSRLVAPVVFMIAAAGGGVGLIWRSSTEARLHVRLALAWLVAILVFFLVSPAPPETRYFMPALVPLTILSVHALYALSELLLDRARLAARLLPLGACLAAVLASAEPVPGGTRGFAPVARSIPIDRNLVTLISSDSFGEGAFVVERLMADREQAGIVLRGSKVLASSDWIGTNYRLLRETVEETYEYLQQVPVHYVVVDNHSASERSSTPDRALLLRTLEAHPNDFRRLRKFPLIVNGTRYDDSIIVFENVTAKHRRPESIQVDLNHTLRRTLELRVGGTGNPSGACQKSH